VVPAAKPASAAAAVPHHGPQHPAPPRTRSEAAAPRTPLASGRPTPEALHPNAIGSVDFKGQFRTRDGLDCLPLTVQDVHSRFVLACQARLDVSLDGVRPVFSQQFREHGCPSAFAPTTGLPSRATGRLSQLTVRFIRLDGRPGPVSGPSNGCSMTSATSTTGCVHMKPWAARCRAISTDRHCGPFRDASSRSRTPTTSSSAASPGTEASRPLSVRR
jgi:hypothetical protein